MSACFQQSAFSLQLLQEAVEHPLEFSGLLRQLLVIPGFDQLQISGQQEVVFQFAGRAHSDETETSELGVAVASASFGQVGGNRRARTLQLSGQPIQLFAGKACRDLINGQRQLMGLRPYLQEMEKKGLFGVYFIFKSMEQGASFRSTAPRYPVADPNYRILTPVRSRFTHYYFYLRDEELGPMIMRVASLYPFQTTYYLNGHSFIERELLRQSISFRKNDNAFLGVEAPAVLQAAADCLSPEILCRRLNHWTLALGPKFSRRERQAMNLNRFYALAQVDFPLLQRLALPLQVGKIRYPGIRIHDTRVLRLMEILMHSVTLPLGWTSRLIHTREIVYLFSLQS